MLKATFSMVKDGMAAMPCITGSVILPALMLAISNLTVSQAFPVF